MFTIKRHVSLVRETIRVDSIIDCTFIFFIFLLTMSKNWEIHSHHEQSLPYSIVAVIAWRRSVCLCWMCGIYCWVRLSRTTGSIVNTWLTLFGGIQPPRLVSVLPVQKQDSLDKFCLSNNFLYNSFYFLRGEKKSPTVCFDDHRRSALCWDLFGVVICCLRL